MLYLCPINLNQNELQNAIIQPLAVAPERPKLGQIYCNSTTSKIMWYNGAKWQTVGVVVESSETNGNIKIDGVEMSVYQLPVASADTIGGVKVGTGLGISADGKLYVTGDATVNSVEWGVVQNKPTTLEGYGITDAVQKEDGKGLSSNDFTNDYKSKLDAIQDGAQANVNADWNATNGDAQILNKPTALSAFTNDEGFIDSSVSNLANYYTKAQTYTQEEVNTLVGNLATIQVQLVDELPETGKSNVIYLVPKAGGAGTNVKDEYLWTGSAFEKIGDTEIDLSSYLTQDGNASNTSVTFTNAGTRDNIATGETMTVLMGKIAKYFADLKTVAFTGSYADLTNKPVTIAQQTKTILAGDTTTTATISNFISYKAFDIVTNEELILDLTRGANNLYTFSLGTAYVNNIDIIITYGI